MRGLIVLQCRCIVSNIWILMPPLRKKTKVGATPKKRPTVTPKKIIVARPRRKIAKKSEKKTGPVLTFERFEENPIIIPNPKNHWESKATFNPAALLIDGKVHLLYRAIGDNDMSVLGYAGSSNGFDIDEQLPYPAYVQDGRNNSGRRSKNVLPLSYCSGGGWNGGCEDPRLTEIGDVVYLLYTAFDGWGSIRIALSSIALEDFRQKKWNWMKTVFISPSGEIHKNWILFPEKINGRFAILHSISPNVLVDYFDSLDEFSEKTFIRSYYSGKSGREDEWYNWVRGAGPTPIKTKHGWLVLYHAMDNSDPNKYKLGAMLLDLEDPTKVLYRTKAPLLEPSECYENEGFKAGVVYCCGAVVNEGRLLIYYGGADTVTCVASIDLDEFLNELIATGKPTIKKKSTIKRKTK